MAAPEMQFIAREAESLFRAHYSKLVWYAQTLLTRNYWKKRWIRPLISISRTRV